MSKRSTDTYGPMTDLPEQRLHEIGYRRVYTPNGISVRRISESPAASAGVLDDDAVQRLSLLGGISAARDTNGMVQARLTAARWCFFHVIGPEELERMDLANVYETATCFDGREFAPSILRNIAAAERARHRLAASEPVPYVFAPMPIFLMDRQASSDAVFIPDEIDWSWVSDRFAEATTYGMELFSLNVKTIGIAERLEPMPFADRAIQIFLGVKCGLSWHGRVEIVSNEDDTAHVGLSFDGALVRRELRAKADVIETGVHSNIDP